MPERAEVTPQSDDSLSLSDPLARYKRSIPWTVAILGGIIIGLWWWGTPPGILGKADAIGYAICHRIAARSFHAHTHQLPLCARCTGIYLGVSTGLLMFAARGRIRAGNLPSVRVLVVMALLGVLYALDGLNSYLSLFNFYTPLYPPHNTLRLLTGMTFGLAMITVVWPVFNMLAWRTPYPQAPLENLTELAALYGVAAVVCLAVLSEIPALLIPLGLISTLGVVLMFSIVGSVIFLTITRQETAVRRWHDLALPGLAGLIFAISVIGAIDLVRYSFTGTWEGFNLLG